MELLKLCNIEKSFRDGAERRNHVLRGVNLSIEAREFIAVKGASGSGKSTLLAVLGMLIEPDSGCYTVDRVEATYTESKLITMRNAMVGFMFQDSRLLPQITALQNILLPTLATKNVASAQEIDYAHELMQLMHISHIHNKYPETLSGGEASRVALCRALIMKPKLLLADEPTGQLDRENAQNVAALLKKVNKDLKTTIVLVTHSDELAAIADRVLTLKEGVLSCT